ncbi:MAG: hypothetical protein IBX72_10345 [Nitrospirae bacterium]|jgi:hypothetical protein|nr:hypothetical protein [Nitrospirota bacterium]
MNIYSAKITNRGLPDKIAFAQHLQNIIGQSLLQNEDFRNLLIELDRKIEATQKEMSKTGIVKECYDCAINGEGTCCGERIGHKCDSILLFINLLLGKTLPQQAEKPHLCFFLTKHGCILRARPVICVNYICKRLSSNIPHAKLVQLQEIAGEELYTLFIIEEYIKKKILSK